MRRRRDLLAVRARVPDRVSHGARRETLGYEPAYAIDLVLAGLGRALGKPVISLETPESQMRAIKMPTAAETNAFVDDGLAELESGSDRPLIDHLVKDWVDGDYADLSRYDEWCECLRNDTERAQARRLIDDRNPAIADAIDKLHAGGQRLFAAVGSLHMIGANGLPQLMRQRGYKVEQADFVR